MRDASRLESIFDRAIQLSQQEERQAYLERACEGNQALRDRLNVLLTAYEEGEFLEAPVFNAAVWTPIAEGPGTLVGNYRLLEQVGEGGMGLVFMAEQSQPIRRRVALKIVKPGLDTRSVIARFEAERQALAMMDHPNIARVFDAGATESGRPYFAMELVRGLPINEYCEKNRLCLRDRLELFIEVCQAVQHAHQRGVIHRDLKPTNILVAKNDTKAVPKVIDFGIAKAITQPLTPRTLFTSFFQIVGTPLYMSPEQAEWGNQDIDTRSDVYSLGVVLYELLTGTTPFDALRLRSVGYDEMRRIIREEEPPKPSTRVTTLSAATTSSPRSLERPLPARTLKGDLDWIVMMAMDKDRQRRYASPGAMVDDLQRFLSNEPIVARPPTAFNKLSKWARRHVIALMMTLAISIISAVVLGVSTLLIAESRDDANALRAVATKERDSAIEQRQRALDERNRSRTNEYFAEIVSSQMDLDQGNLARVNQKLVRHLPIDNESDRRGWEWYYLFSQCHPEDRAFYCITPWLFATWSPDGKWIGSNGAIWNSQTGQCVRLLSPTSHECTWSADGQLFVWISAGNARIWDRRTNHVRSLSGNHADTWTVSLSPDATKLATTFEGTNVRIWDIKSGSLLHTLEGVADSTITDLKWSPDGALLAVGAYQVRAVSIYTTDTFRLVHRHNMSDYFARTRLSWHPNGTQLAINRSDGWRILDRADWSVRIEHAHPSALASEGAGVDIQWNPEGTLVAYSERAKLVVWDPRIDQEVRRFTGHASPIHSLSWHSDGSRLLSSDRSNEIRVWDLRSLQQPPEINLELPLEQLSWDPGNDVLAGMDHDLTFTRWNVANGEVVQREKLSTNVEGALRTLSPDRRWIANPISLGAMSEKLEVREVNTGSVQSVYVCDAPFKSIAGLRPHPISRSRASFAWSPDGSSLAIGIVSEEETGLDVWNPIANRRLLRWTRPGVKNDTTVRHVTWSPDGRRIAFAGFGDRLEKVHVYLPRVHVIDVATGRRVLKHAVGAKGIFHGEITAVAWSLDSQFVALGTTEGQVDVVSLKSGRRTANCKAHDVPIHAIAWHPDGTRLATAAADGSVKLLDVDRGNELLSFSVGNSAPNQLAWSSDGRRLAAATNTIVRVWDATHGFSFAAGGPRHHELAWLYLGVSSQPEGDAVNRQILKLAPKIPDYRWLRGSASANLGLFDQAALEFAAARPSEFSPGLWSTKQELYAYLGARDLNAYRQRLAKLLKTIEVAEEFEDRDAAYWMACLIPEANIDLARHLPDLREYVSARGDEPILAANLGALLYRLGQYTQSYEELAALTKRLEAISPPDHYYLALTKLFQSMAKYRLHHEPQAKRLFEEATHARSKLLRDPSTRWQYHVEIDTLHREAEALLAPRTP